MDLNKSTKDRIQSFNMILNRNGLYGTTDITDITGIKDTLCNRSSYPHTYTGINTFTTPLISSILAIHHKNNNNTQKNEIDILQPKDIPPKETHEIGTQTCTPEMKSIGIQCDIGEAEWIVVKNKES